MDNIIPMGINTRRNMTIQLFTGATVETKEKSLETAVAVYFDIVQEHSISLQSQITDNWLENSTPVNDHIANQPLVINLRGLAGELVYTPSTTDGALAYIRDTAKNKLGTGNFNKLSSITSLYPPVDNITQLAKNTISYIEASQKRYEKIIKRFFSNDIRKEKLRKIYQDFNSIRENKIALFVQTPFGSFDNMYIQSLTLRQGNENYVTDIELSLKKLYFNEGAEITSVNEQNRERCNFLQRETVENHGQIQGKFGGVDGDGNSNGDTVFKLSASFNDYR